MRKQAPALFALALGVAVAVIWPGGRLWLLLAVLFGAEVLARRHWRDGTKWPAIAVWTALVLFGAGAAIGQGTEVADESATRRLYAEPLKGSELIKGRALGPTGVVEAQLVLVNDELVSVQFFHQEPPWVGDPVLARLAKGIMEAKRLVPPREGSLGAPIERAGLRACELALLPPADQGFSHRAWRWASGSVQASQAVPVLAAVPSVWLLLLLVSLAAGRLAGARE